MRHSVSRPSCVLLLLSLLSTLLVSLSAQTITSVRGCSDTADNRTSQCSTRAIISIGGHDFLPTTRQQSLSIFVDSAACQAARYVDSALLTCRLPAAPTAGRSGEWLNVTAVWRYSNRTQPFTGVSYAALNSTSSSSSSSSSSAPSIPSSGVASTGAASPSSSSSAPSLTSSSTGSPSVPNPVVTSIRGCVDVASYTANCTYTSRLTIEGAHFGNRSAFVYFTLAQTPSPVVYAANDTTIVCAVPPLQYEPQASIPIRVYSSSGQRSPLVYGVSFDVIRPVITALRSGSQRNNPLRVYPGATITVIGNSFPLSGNVLVVLNKTASSHGAQYLGGASVLSTSQIVATLPSNINADVALNTPLSLSVTTFYANSLPFTPGVVILPSTTVSSSTGGAGPIQPVISSISGCEDDGNRTRSCLMYQSITLTISGRNFAYSPVERVLIGNNSPPQAYCATTTQQAPVNTVYCVTPAQSFMLNQVYQVSVLWRDGRNATFYGVYFTEQLDRPTVDSISGAGCDWNGTAATNCRRGNSDSAWLTISGQHFPLYLKPNITVGGASCDARPNDKRVKERLTCRVTDASLPANTLLPLRITFPAAAVQSIDYHVAFRSIAPYTSTGRNGGGGGGGGGGGSQAAGGTRLSLEDELIIALLSATTAVLLLVGAIFGVTYIRLRRARLQHSGDSAWNEMVGGGDGQRGFRMGDAADGQPAVAAPYVPLVAQQMGLAAREQGAGRDEGEWQSWEGIPSPR